MASDKIKNLRGTSRRNFLRLTTAAGAALMLEPARTLDVIADLGGSAMADEAQAKTLRSVHIVGGDGGFAWFQLLWPHVEVAKAANPAFAWHALGQAVDATDTDHELVHGPDTPWQELGAKKRISAFMAGQPIAHTQVPNSAIDMGNGQTMLATVAAIQRATPSLLPVIGVSTDLFGEAPGRPELTTVADAQGMVGLFDSAASQLTLQARQDGELFEAYYKATVGLTKASSRPTMARQLRIGKTASGFLGRNLASLLQPTAEDLARYGINAGTPTILRQLGETLIVTAKIFKQGLSQSVITSALEDDPHATFGDQARLFGTPAMLRRFLDEFMKDLMVQDPLDSGKNISDNVVITIHGDTPKSPLQGPGDWADATPRNSNWIYVMGNGYLKTGWFGRVRANGEVLGFDPTSGNDVPLPNVGTPTNATSAPAAAAVAYAVARGDMRRVQDFYNGPAITGMVNEVIL